MKWYWKALLFIPLGVYWIYKKRKSESTTFQDSTNMPQEEESDKFDSFLRRFRAIADDDSLTIAEKVKEVQRMRGLNDFLPKVVEEYGDDFPLHIFTESLTSIAGVTSRVAENLFDRGIYTPEALKELSKEELLSIEGIGPKRAEKIQKLD